MDFSTQLTTAQKQRVVAKFRSASGQDRPVDGVPQWSTDDPNVATLEVAPDGRSAYIVSQAPGSCRVFCRADAKLDEGVNEITGVIDVEVVEDPAAIVEFEFDEPQFKSE